MPLSFGFGNKLLFSKGNAGAGQAQAYSIVSDSLIVNVDASNASSYSGTGSTWTDISGSGNNITLYNSPTFDSASKSLVFNGSNQYASFAKPSFLTSSSQFSIDMWVKWTTTGTTTSTIQCLVDNNHSDSPIRGFVIQDRPDMSKALTFSVNPSQSGVSTTSQIGNGTWRHVVATYDGTNSKFYIDGVYNATLAQSSFNPTATITLCYWQGGGRYLSGNVRSFRLYSKALTVSEITQNYNATKF